MEISSGLDFLFDIVGFFLMACGAIGIVWSAILIIDRGIHGRYNNKHVVSDTKFVLFLIFLVFVGNYLMQL